MHASSGSAVTVIDEAGLGCAEAVRQAVQVVLALHAPRPGDVEAILTHSGRLRTLNREHRGLDEATDVLSFPGPDWPGAPLGEIAVSAEHVQEGARRRGVEPAQEAMFLAAHGALHLCGFQDGDDDGRAEMVRLANEALADLGVEPCPDWESLPHSGAH